MFQVDLIEQCKINDRKAQLRLYNQYAEGMYHIAYRFMGNKEEAEDVMQEAFIKAFQKLHQFKGEVTFGAWLKRIVVNHSLDSLKKRHNDVSTEEVQLEVVDDDQWEVDETLSLDEIRAVIRELPEKYSAVVQLYLVEGYEHAEVAETLGITEVASRTQLMRGKALLKERLKLRRNGTES